MTTEGQDSGYEVYYQNQTLGRHLSQEEQARLLANEYGEEGYYQYLSQITKSYFGFSIVSDIMPWVEEDEHGKIIVIRKSPFTARTTRAIKKLALSLFDQAEYLQNLEAITDQRKADLWVDKLFNLVILEVNRMDTENKEFWGILETMKRHSWTIRTRAKGWNRERILQARRTTEFIQKLGAVQPPQREQPKSKIDMVLGR